MMNHAVSGNTTALVADDDEFFRAALHAILTSSLGFARVIEVGSFDEAADRLGEEGSSKAISLALFDLSMPGLSNPANLRSIREALPDITVVVISASERRSDILASLEAGVHGYVPKGLGISELERALGLVLDGTIYVPALLADISRAPDQVRTPWAERPTAARHFPELTPRQQDVLELIVKGKSNKEIARALDVREGTVRVHMTALFRNLGVTNRTAAAATAASMLGRPSP